MAGKENVAFLARYDRVSGALVRLGRVARKTTRARLGDAG